MPWQKNRLYPTPATSDRYRIRPALYGSKCRVYAAIIGSGDEPSGAERDARLHSSSVQRVYITHWTRLVWNQLGIKLGVHLELQRRQLEACLMELQANDQPTAVIDSALPQGALHLNDLALFKRQPLQDWREQAVYWLVRYNAKREFACLTGTDNDWTLKTY